MSQTALPLIELQNISYTYRRGDMGEIPALEAISLKVERGEFVAVVGSNGSGKSTLAKTMNALLLPTEGEVFVDGMRTLDAENLWDIRRMVGMVFQNPDNQLISTTVEEEIAFGLENLGIPTEEMKEIIDRVLGEVGMLEMRRFEPHNLSGGQKQRVAIAAVLAMQPACLVMDEATSMLDPEGRHDVLTTVRHLCREKGLSVVFITHFMEEAAQADRVIVLDQGRVYADATPREIFGTGIDLYSVGLDVPPITRLARALREDGFPVSLAITQVDELVNEIWQLYSKM